MATFLLTVTFTETLIVTLYAPVIQILFPRLLHTSIWYNRKLEQQELLRRQKEEDGEAEILPPFAQTRNHYWNIAIYSMDVIICGLVMYYSGPFSNPPFGIGSPFYRYGISTVFAAAAAFKYEGGLVAAVGYDLFALFGMFVHAPGATPYTPNAVDVVGSLIDTPIIAILVAYLSTLLENYAHSKRQERENARTQASLVNIGNTLLKSTGDRQELLSRSIKPIQRERFDRLTIMLIDLTDQAEDFTGIQAQISQGNQSDQQHTIVHVATALPEDYFPASSQSLMQKVLQSEQKLISFESIEGEQRGFARLYIPLRKDDHVQIILAAESKRITPFTAQHEKFLTIAGTQLLVALDNIRLAEQTVQLAADAERGRIAREIHDGIAQLTYMLSLQAETCEAQALRIAEASEEDAELIMPLAERLGKLVTVSKQALWETRNYMFSLKPLMSGTTTLTQMLNNQLREFEAISDLPTHLHIEGSDELYEEQRRRSRRYAQIGTTFFRIVQEALTNAYKHADATHLEVHLRYQPDHIEVDICDDGRGFSQPYKDNEDTASGEPAMILSGHGLPGMQARTSELGGQFAILQQPSGYGTIVRASIPL
jgi:signal transduction histidine kinase